MDARIRVAAGVALVATVVSAACGSTAPSAPSPTPGPSAQYPSLLGHWREDSSILLLQYRDADGTPGRWGCQSELLVQQQTAGAFSGVATIKGGGSSSDKQCTWQFFFTAQISPDGTLTSFLPSNGKTFVTEDCTPVSQATFSGTSTDAAIRITMTDRATCKDFFGQSRDTNRTLTMSVTSRFGLTSTSMD